MKVFVIVAATLAAFSAHAGEPRPERYYSSVGFFTLEVKQKGNVLAEFGVPDEEVDKILMIFAATRHDLRVNNIARAAEICNFNGSREALAGAVQSYFAQSYGDMAKLKPRLKQGVDNYAYHTLEGYLSKYGLLEGGKDTNWPELIRSDESQYDWTIMKFCQGAAETPQGDHK